MRRRAACRAALLTACLAVLAPTLGRAETFTDRFTTPFTAPIGQALARTIGRSLPVLSASSGVSFTFNPESGAFERDVDISGQLYLEHGRPLGRGKWNLNVSYQWVRVDQLDGRDMSELRDPGPPIVDPASGRPFTVPQYDLSLNTHQWTWSGTYGVTDDLDVNLTVPVLLSDLTVHARARDLLSGKVQRDDFSTSAFGVGDLFLRGKYRLLHAGWGDVALGLVLRIPTGEEENFQGTGDWEVTPLVYASTRAMRLHGPVRIQLHFNGGIDLNADDVDRSEGRYGIGADLLFGDRGTLGIAFLGREMFGGIAPPGAFDVTRVNPRTGQRSVSPALGLDRSRQSYYDLSIGGRVKLYRDTIFGFGNVIVPLNDDGFRSDVIPLIGIEVVF